jgi:hypothetical protein
MEIIDSFVEKRAIILDIFRKYCGTGVDAIFAFEFFVIMI